jgi:hypothetical protein
MRPFAEPAKDDDEAVPTTSPIPTVLQATADKMRGLVDPDEDDGKD